MGDAPPLERPWATPIEAVEQTLGTDVRAGLEADEARRRLAKHGPNRIRRVEHRSLGRILWDQLANVVVALLAAAGIISAAVGQWEDAAAIAVVVVVNTVIGFTTELRARRSMEALQKIGEIESVVVRGGERETIEAADLVPGDLVFLGAGATIGADLRLVSLDDLTVDESALTGESVPVDKRVDPVGEDAGLADRSSMAFNGTAVARGEGYGVVVATGMETELGQISALVESAGEEQTPLEDRLDELARRLVWLTVVVAALVGGAGVLAERGTLEMLQTSIALAVAAIPEGLPIVATVALARGMRRMLRRNALIRRLSSVETLGATNVICTDKTGTLTENRMEVCRVMLADREVTLGSGEPPEIGEPAFARLVESAVLCNTATLAPDGVQEGRGDPMEQALLRMGVELGRERSALLEAEPQQRVVPFDRATKMMATFHEAEGSLRVAVKGAPEAVLEASVRERVGAEERPLDRDAWVQRNEAMATDGLRVLAIAEGTAESADDDPYGDLTFLGLVGLMDPPRTAVPDAVQACRDAGIRVIMVTGDHPATAAAIAQQVRIVDSADEEVLHGDAFDASDAVTQSVSVVARVSPEQKLQLIDALQSEGLVVAMTGDGVNDAPALKGADIGVAMGGRGTEVAREASDMVLQDDAFETIVAAVREGRIIFDNIRRFVVYLLSGNVGEILAVGVAAAAGWPLPLLPLQILYLNVLNDVFPALALGVGSGSDEVMHRPPRHRSESVLSRQQWLEVVGFGVMIGGVVLGVFGLAMLWLGLDSTSAVTVSFLSLSTGRLLHAFNMRSIDSGLFTNDVVRNGWLWGAIVLCVGLLMLAVYLPPLAGILKLGPIGAAGWALVAMGSLAPLFIGQVALLGRRALRR